MYKQEVTQKVNAQEERTRKAMDKLIPDLFKSTLKKSNWTHTLCNVDYQFTASTKNESKSYDLEVKEFDRVYEYIEDCIGGCGIKCEKFIRMKQFNEYQSENDCLLYMIVLNDAIVIYDIKKIDLNKCKWFMWKQKKTQYDDDSEIVEVPAFNIPLDQAIYKEYFNKAKYYDERN